MYEDQTYEEILERAIGNARSDIDTTEGSIFYSALAPACFEFAMHYFELDGIVREGYADTCSRENLILRCKERGITPYSATQAVLKGKFDVDIGLDARFSITDDELNYISIAFINSEVVDGTTYYYYQMQCEDSGTEGNRHFGTLEAIEFISDLNVAELTELLIPGEDEEDTEDLRERYFGSFETAPFGGNKKDYKEKTNALSGVGSTKVIPVWNGGGTVLLIILNSEYEKASQVLIDTVQTAIDPLNAQGQGNGIAPIGHVVTVRTVEEVTVQIAVTLTYREGYSWNRLSEEITDAMEDYLLELRQDWANQNQLIVRITQIETRILQITGVVDITGTKINGVTDNLTLTYNQIPVANAQGVIVDEG